eukprot:NODE_112_length_18534_cov_1.163656.p12 type:complete len:156 gc:universal NODE_112_length_18534_cov_1.163656:5333-4866(-)
MFALEYALWSRACVSIGSGSEYSGFTELSGNVAGTSGRVGTVGATGALVSYLACSSTLGISFGTSGSFGGVGKLGIAGGFTSLCASYPAGVGTGAGGGGVGGVTFAGAGATYLSAGAFESYEGDAIANKLVIKIIDNIMGIACFYVTSLVLWIAI